MKRDIKQELKPLYAPPASDFAIVEVPSLAFLMLDGQGDPNTAPAFAEAVEALFATSYTLKFAIKKQQGIDYGVLPLEGLWWSDEETFVDPSASNRDQWHWTLMIMQPDMASEDDVRADLEATRHKKALPALERVRYETWTEGLAVQILHIGPFANEAPTIARMHQQFIPTNGLQEAGKHHEIYLSDFRRTAPERLRTVLRQPVRRVS